MVRFCSNSLVFSAVLAVAGSAAFAQDTPPQTLITNVNIFDGVNADLIENGSVLVEGNKITAVSAEPLAAANAVVIDGGGRTLMPGIIGCHEHVMLQMPVTEMLSADTRYMAVVATHTAKQYLMNGWTSVRDAGGNIFALKKGIDKGYIVGPRIYPSGPMISQTGGHADHRHQEDPAMVGGDMDNGVKMGDMALADGVPEVLKASRDALRRGATQVKIAVGGGTGSYADPLEVIEYLPEEIEAAVKAAEDYKTYVLAHVYNDEGTQRALKAGVKSIEHGNLLHEETLQMMKDADAWLCAQVIVFTETPKGYTEDQANKHRQALEGTGTMFEAAKKVGFENIGFGTDIITDPEMIARMNEEFVLRTEWFDNAEILRQATSKNGEILGLSDRFNPGKIGVIEEGALADILLVDGNPLEDIAILTDPAANLDLIMKNGVIYKNEM